MSSYKKLHQYRTKVGFIYWPKCNTSRTKLLLAMRKMIIIMALIIGCTSTKNNTNGARNVAQSINTPSGCPTLTANNLNIENLNNFIRHPNCKIKSVDDVLKLLPNELFLNGTLVYKSRSLQGPHKVDYFHPRAILNHDEKFFLTYNSNPNDLGFNALELAEVDLSEKEISKIMKFQEISFPDNSQSMSWSEVQSKIHTTEINPSKCTSCHGIPARPIFPSYPLWVGFYGFANGQSDKIEEKNYQLLWEKAKNDPKSRYHRYQFEYTPPLFMRNENLNDVFGNINSAVTARKIKKTSNYNEYKYSIFAALINCEDSPSFLGNKLKLHVDHLDSNLNITKKWGNEAVDKKIRQIVTSQRLFMLDHWRMPNDAYKMNDFYSKYGDYINPDPTKKLPEDFIKETKKNFIERMSYFGGNNQFITKLAADTFDIQSDYERMYYTPVLLRLIFEGRGIPLNTWALDLTQPTYRFHMTLQNIVKHLSRDDNDPIIVELLKIAEQGNPMTTPLLTPEIDNNKAICTKLKSASIKRLDAIKFVAKKISYSDIVTSNEYPSVFQSACIKCHGQYEFMAPYIPFENAQEMKKWASNDKNKNLLKHRVFDALENDRMPPTRHLSDDEKDSIKAFLSNL